MGALVLIAGCAGSIRSRTLLEMFNKSEPAPPPVFVPLRQEVSDFFRQNLPDAYWNPACVNALVDPARAVDPLAKALACASRARGLDAEDVCFHHLYEAMRLPRTPPPDKRTAPAWAREQDITRLETNLKLAIRATVSHYTTAHLRQVDPADPEIRAGLAQGLTAFREYHGTRKVIRDRSRPVSTLVMSGGAARGAYSAGAIWWMLTRLHACKSEAEQRIARACGKDAACARKALEAAENACLSDKVDMVSGTSTGSLITLLVKDYFDHEENRRQRALDMLVQSYTCSTNSELYCVVDATLDDLGLNPNGKAQGLVRFDGIEKRLNDYIDDRMLLTPTEYFAGTVEFQSGRTLHLSSADRRDVPDPVALRRAVLASISEPVLAEPVHNVGIVEGTFIDGGIRSGLPLLTPLLRGAERAIVFVNGPLAPTPLHQPPPHAGAIGMRMIDLFAYQPIVGELHEAEYRLSVKRSLEYERCAERLSEKYAEPGDSLPQACNYEGLPQRMLTPSDRARARAGEAAARSEPAVHELCSGQVWPSDGRSTLPDVETPSDERTPFPHQISRSYRATWLFVPHEVPESLKGPNPVEPGVTLDAVTAAGYQFDPKAMWKMFVLGAAVAQQRCAQLDDTLAWHLGKWCGTPDDLRAALAPIRAHASQSCWNKDVKKLRDCR